MSMKKSFGLFGIGIVVGLIFLGIQYYVVISEDDDDIDPDFISFLRDLDDINNFVFTILLLIMIPIFIYISNKRAPGKIGDFITLAGGALFPFMLASVIVTTMEFLEVF